MVIKVCGLTKPGEAEYLNRNHVDFAGIVLFYPKSRRNNTIRNAKEIIKNLDSSIQKVAVVVSPLPEQIREIEQAGFDYVQVHGELSKEVLEEISLPVLRAFNVKDMNLYESYHSCKKVAGYVFDALEPGSGKTFDWNLVKTLPKDEKLLFLAGGLHAGNVAEAIRAIQPDGVDVSSGVEREDGQGKDLAKIELFVNAVRNVKKISKSAKNADKEILKLHI